MWATEIRNVQNEWRMVECEVQNPVGGLMQLNKELCLGCPFNPVVLVTEEQSTMKYGRAFQVMTEVIVL